MTTPQNPSVLSTPSLVRDLDDATLRSGHALLDGDRAQDFASWIDGQLEELELEFQALSTPQSRRRALGR